MPARSEEMYIEGHRLTQTDMEAFGALMRCGTMVAASAESGIPVTALRRIMDSAWFQKLWEYTGALKNKAFLHQLQELDAQAIQAYREIITGERSEDKSTGAAAKLIEARMKAGRDPVLDTRAQVTKITNEQHNTINITPDQIRAAKLTQDELIELNRTGILPDRLRQGAVPQPMVEWEPPRTLGVDDLGAEGWEHRKAREAELAEGEEANQPQPVTDADTRS